MRALSWAAFLSALVLAVPQCLPAQANPFPEGVWIDCSKPQEAQGLSLVTKEGQYQTVEWDHRQAWATDNANKKTLLAFVIDPGFKLNDRDTISVIIEHRGDVRLGYTGDAGYQTLEPARTRGLEEWVTGRWQITDAAFARPDGQGIRLEFWSDGGAGAPDIFLASVKVTHEAARIGPSRVIVPADGKTKTPFAVDVFDPGGEPAPDGTEVALTCENLPVPASAITQAGRATFEVTSGSEARTGRIEESLGQNPR